MYGEGIRKFSFQALLIAALLFVAACSSCETEKKSAPTPPPATPAPQADGDFDREGLEYTIEVKMIRDGDRMTPVPIRTYIDKTPTREQKEAVKIDFPPDAFPYATILSTPECSVVRFPEYKQRTRFSSNGYGVLDMETREALIIDPGIGSVRMMRFWAEREKANVVAIAVTHGHLDHTGGVMALKQSFPKAIFYAPKEDAEWMGKPDPKNFSGVRAELPPPPDRLIGDRDIIEAGALVFDVIHTPGHTGGSVCLSLPDRKILFSGDTLFYNNIGRTNFSHSLTMHDEILSIITKLGDLPDDTLVLPGHGKKTTLGTERRENRYIKAGKKRISDQTNGKTP